MKAPNTTVNVFLKLNSERVSNCFTSCSSSDSKRSIFFRIQSRSFKPSKKIFEYYAMIFLTINEPMIVLAQLVMRRGGGLNGSYQFHRLYEIRKIVNTERISSANEFGSGASSLLFNKYIERFVTIEESESWASHYLEMLNSIKWFPGLKSNIKNLDIHILPRLEFLDSTRELVCSYVMPDKLMHEEFELVYIDGPTSWIQSKIHSNTFIRDKEKLIPNTSILALSAKPRIILIDGRRATVSYLIEKGNLGNAHIGLRGTYRCHPGVRPYHTSIYT